MNKNKRVRLILLVLIKKVWLYGYKNNLINNAIKGLSCTNKKIV